MKHLILLALFAIFPGCKSADIKADNSNHNPDYRIVQIPMIYQRDTLYVNELRFYRISSAMNTGQVFYDAYGAWDHKIESLHGPIVRRLIWENRTLLENQGLFTVVSDGLESKNEYYSSVMIFDRDDNDALHSDHPNYSALVECISQMMQERKENKAFYVLSKDR